VGRGVVILLHGIHTSRKEADEWMPELAAFITSRTGLRTHLFKYGWTSGASIALPGIGWAGRRRKTRKFQRCVQRLQRSDIRGIGPIHVVAHSFGTWIARYGLIRGPEELRPRFGTFVMMGGIVHAADRFTEGRVGRVACLYSRDDDVVRLAPGFGDCGRQGLRGADGGRLVNVDCTPAAHRDYTRQGPAWEAVAGALFTTVAGGTRL
jgi:pimeloyl-ACP methyl ester carboxylesterase